MHYTSGTTGRAKGVWSDVLDEATARRLFEDEADLWGFDAGDLHLVCSPMYHSVSIRFAAGTLLRGGSLVILSRFDAAVAADGCGGCGPTTTFLAPTALQRLLRCPGRRRERCDSFRLVVHAGSPAPRHSNGRPWHGSRPVPCGSSTDRPRASSRCVPRRVGGEAGDGGPGPTRAPAAD